MSLAGAQETNRVHQAQTRRIDFSSAPRSRPSPRSDTQRLARRRRPQQGARADEISQPLVLAQCGHAQQVPRGRRQAGRGVNVYVLTGTPQRTTSTRLALAVPRKRAEPLAIELRDGYDEALARRTFSASMTLSA